MTKELEALHREWCGECAYNLPPEEACDFWRELRAALATEPAVEGEEWKCHQPATADERTDWKQWGKDMNRFVDTLEKATTGHDTNANQSVLAAICHKPVGEKRWAGICGRIARWHEYSNRHDFIALATPNASGLRCDVASEPCEPSANLKSVCATHNRVDFERKWASMGRFTPPAAEPAQATDDAVAGESDIGTCDYNKDNPFFGEHNGVHKFVYLSCTYFKPNGHTADGNDRCGDYHLGCHFTRRAHPHGSHRFVENTPPSTLAATEVTEAVCRICSHLLDRGIGGVCHVPTKYGYCSCHCQPANAGDESEASRDE